MIKKPRKFGRKRKLPYWICYETDLDYERICKSLEQETPGVWAEETRKGLIQLFFREEDIMVQISPKGKVTTYFDVSYGVGGKEILKRVKRLIEKLTRRKVNFRFYKCDPRTEEHYASLAADYEVSLSLDAEAGEKQK